MEGHRGHDYDVEFIDGVCAFNNEPEPATCLCNWESVGDSDKTIECSIDGDSTGADSGGWNFEATDGIYFWSVSETYTATTNTYSCSQGQIEGDASTTTIDESEYIACGLELEDLCPSNQ